MSLKNIPIYLALLLVSTPNRGICGQPSDAMLVTFQKFVNGEVPIKEAVVYRQLSGTNGVVSNREWWRFGYQNDTWFVQRLIPDVANSAQLVPDGTSVCGSSLKQLWVVGDKTLSFAIKDAARGSRPEAFGRFYGGLMFTAISLGVPREMSDLKIADVPVEWKDLEFNTIVGSTRGQSGEVLATAPIKGQLEIGNNGLPSSAKFSGVGQFPNGAVTYTYSPDTVGIPKSFVVKFSDAIFRYEFLSLTLGSNDLAKTDGYVPSLFADLTRKRDVVFYTNDLGYIQIEGKSYPTFGPPAPKLGELAPKLQGTNWFDAPNPLTLDGLRGKVVLLDFWGINCPPCIEALPHSEALYDKFKNEGLMVIGICGGWGSEQRAARILKDRNITFPNMVDADLAIADGKYGGTAWSYVLDDAPSYVLIDRSGNLVWKSENEPTESQIRELLELSIK